MRRVRVVLVDDHEIVRAGVASLLAREPDIDVVGSAADAESGREVVAALRPDILVVDHRLPGATGVDLCGWVTTNVPGVAVIVLTTFLDEEVVLSAVEAGARAYVHKDVEAAELKRAIRAVAAGKSVLDPAVTARVMELAARRRDRGGSLSEREMEVLRLVAKGLTTDEISGELNVSVSTVKTYVARCMDKLSVSSRSAATAEAAKRGWL